MYEGDCYRQNKSDVKCLQQKSLMKVQLKCLSNCIIASIPFSNTAFFGGISVSLTSCLFLIILLCNIKYMRSPHHGPEAAPALLFSAHIPVLLPPWSQPCTTLQLPGVAAPATETSQLGWSPAPHSPALSGHGATHTLLSQPGLGPFRIPGRCSVPRDESVPDAPCCQVLAGTVEQALASRACHDRVMGSSCCYWCPGPQGATCSCCFLTCISFFPLV